MRFVNVLRDNANNHPRCFLIFIICAGVVLLVLGGAKVVIGATYAGDCPSQPFVCVYLIVSGVVPLAFSLTVRFRSDSYGDRKCTVSRFQVLLFGVLCMFLFIWLILGTIYIAGIHEKVQTLHQCLPGSISVTPAEELLSTNTSTTNRAIPACVSCDRNLARMAIAMVATDWSLACVGIVLFCACACFSLVVVCLLTRDDEAVV